MIGGQTI